MENYISEYNLMLSDEELFPQVSSALFFESGTTVILLPISEVKDFFLQNITL